MLTHELWIDDRSVNRLVQERHDPVLCWTRFSAEGDIVPMPPFEEFVIAPWQAFRYERYQTPEPVKVTPSLHDCSNETLLAEMLGRFMHGSEAHTLLRAVLLVFDSHDWLGVTG
jgi:hypothetical protein